MHLISSQNASLWIDQMCFSVSRYMLTSSTSCIDAILCMMLFHANMEWDDNEFISTQELKKKGSRANRHLYLAICFKRQMPKIKLLQIEILVNLSVPSFTVSVGRMSLPLSGHYDAYSCATCLSILDVSLVAWCLLWRSHRIGAKNNLQFSIFSIAIGLVAWSTGLCSKRP